MFEVTTPTGRIGLWDAQLGDGLSREDPARPEASAALRERARAGEVFFLDTEDAERVRIEVVVGHELPATYRDHFDGGSGAFRLRAPSGDLRLGSLPPDGSAVAVDAPAGELLVTLYRRDFDPQRYAEEMRRIVGEADWQLRERVMKIGAAGCFSILIGALLIALPPTRLLWWLWVLIFSLPTLTYAALQRLPRLRRIEAAVKRVWDERPEMVILLRPSQAPEEIEGGWLTGV